MASPLSDKKILAATSSLGSLRWMGTVFTEIVSFFYKQKLLPLGIKFYYYKHFTHVAWNTHEGLFYALLKEKAFLGLKYFKCHLHANSVFFHAWMLALCRSLGGLINRSDFHCQRVNHLHLSIISSYSPVMFQCYISSLKHRYGLILCTALWD